MGVAGVCLQLSILSGIDGMNSPFWAPLPPATAGVASRAARPRPAAAAAIFRFILWFSPPSRLRLAAQQLFPARARTGLAAAAVSPVRSGVGKFVRNRNQSSCWPLRRRPGNVRFADRRGSGMTQIDRLISADSHVTVTHAQVKARPASKHQDDADAAVARPLGGLLPA